MVNQETMKALNYKGL